MPSLQIIIRDSREVKYKNHWNGNGRGKSTRVVVHEKVRKSKQNDKGHGHHE